MAEESEEEKAEGSEEESGDEDESGDDETMSTSDVKAVHFDLDQEKEELKKVKGLSFFSLTILSVCIFV